MSLSITIRSLWRNKLYSFINIFGLALGIAAFLLILEYVSFERSTNGFHKALPNIYRLLNEDAKGKTWSQIAPGWANRAKDRFAAIEAFCRFEDGVAQGLVSKVGKQAETFRESSIGYADGNFFDFFTFPLLQGKTAALKTPNTVFISEACAKKYFGASNALGEQLKLNNQFGETLYTIGGIFSIPENSDIRYDMVFSLETLRNPNNLNGNSWAEVDNIGSQYIYTYFRLKPGTNVKAMEAGLNALKKELDKDPDGVIFRLQAFKHVHLPASFDDYYQTTGNLRYISILSLVALLILLIAWFNYINLSTANVLKRANEVGVRKVIGASRQSLVVQFLGESLLVNALGFALALLLVYLLQPWFNGLVGKQLSLHNILATNTWATGLLLLVVGSLLSGAYTAYSLSNFKPIDTLKGKINRSIKGTLLRKSLVVAQVTISIVLIIATVIIYQQLQYMQQKNLGVNPEKVLVLRGPEAGRDSTYANRRTAFMNALAQQSFVKEYTLSGSIPGSWYNFSTSGFTQPGSNAGDELKSYSFAIIDQNYLGTYQIPLFAGRNFTASECAIEWNDNNKILINERALQSLGFKNADEALRTPIQWDERALEIIGVVKDYHHTGLQNAIDPILFYPQNNNTFISIRLSSNNLDAGIKQLETLFKTWFAGNPYEYFFADDNFNKQYVTEKQYGKLFTIASLWAILIACLGLFGLTTFTVESRTREVGIRKVLGASTFSIASLISTDFLKLVLLASMVAFPIAWYAMYRWLQDFAYQVHISLWTFISVAGAAVFIALVTIAFKAIGAALANPVKSIRTE